MSQKKEPSEEDKKNNIFERIEKAVKKKVEQSQDKFELENIQNMNE